MAALAAVVHEKVSLEFNSAKIGSIRWVALRTVELMPLLHSS